MLRFIRVIGLVGAAAAVAVASAGCSAPRNHAGGPGIVTNGAYVAAAGLAGTTTVGYLDIRNNGAADELVSVSTSVGGTVELRGPVTQGVSPVMMHTVKDIPIPVRHDHAAHPEQLSPADHPPGAMHDGKDIMLTLTFAHGLTMTMFALVTNPQNGGSSYFLN